MKAFQPERIPQNFASASAMLHRDVLEMTVDVREQLDEAVNSLLYRNSSMVEDSLLAHADLRNAADRFDFTGLEVLVNFEFSDSRLRKVLGTMQIARKVRRISDHAADIARRSEELMEMPESHNVNLIEPVYDEVAGMLSQVTASLADDGGNSDLDLSSITRDLDVLVRACLTRLSASTARQNENIQHVLKLAFVVYALQGIAGLIEEICTDLRAVRVDREGAA